MCSVIWYGLFRWGSVTLYWTDPITFALRSIKLWKFLNHFFIHFLCFVDKLSILFQLCTKLGDCLILFSHFCFHLIFISVEGISNFVIIICVVLFNSIKLIVYVVLRDRLQWTAVEGVEFERCWCAALTRQRQSIVVVFNQRFVRINNSETAHFHFVGNEVRVDKSIFVEN